MKLKAATGNKAAKITVFVVKEGDRRDEEAGMISFRRKASRICL